MEYSRHRDRSTHVAIAVEVLAGFESCEVNVWTVDGECSPWHAADGPVVGEAVEYIVHRSRIVSMCSC